MTLTVVNQLCVAALERFKPRHFLPLNLGGFPVLLRSNSEALVVKLRAAYSNYIVPTDHEQTSMRIDLLQGDAPPLPVKLNDQPPSPGKSKIKEAFANLEDGRLATRLGTGLLFVSSHEHNQVIGPCLDYLNRIVDFINSRYCQWRVRSGAVLFHAAVVEINGRGLALAGFPDRGKSSLALQLIHRSARFVSDDRALVHPNVLYGLPKSPRLNPGTLLTNPALRHLLSADECAKYQAMPESQLWDLDNKRDVDIEQCFGRPQILHCPFDALVILNWQHGASPTRIGPVKLREREDLWPTFVKTLGLFCDPDLSRNVFVEDIDRYLAITDSSQVLEVSGGIDFNRAIDMCEQL